MKKFGFIIFALLFLFSCNHSSKSTQVNMQGNFNQFKDDFIEKLWITYPTWATGVGYHKYDSLLTAPDEAARQNELKFAQWTEDGLKQYAFDSLSSSDKTDYKMIQNFIDGLRFNINEFKSYEWDPSAYNLGDAIFNIVDYKQMTIDEKLRNLSKRLAKVPAYFEAAKNNIKSPTWQHTKLAIDQNKGTLYFFKSVFPDSLKSSKLSESETAEFKQNADTAQKAIEGYIDWLQKNILAKSDSTQMRSFRIGKELYSKKFLLDVDSRYTAAEMYKKAEDRKTYLHNEMNQLTDIMWSKYFQNQKAPADTLQKIKMMIDKLSLQHCKRDKLLEAIEKQLPELTAFIITHNIIDPDTTKPLKVRKTPEYTAGVAGAGINSPGPYDKDAVTYYNVTPLTKYSEEKAESYLREYNDYVLQILNIHEAIPGHYTQLIYSNRSPSIIKTVFGNGAMIEGWACYVERMMIEEGYHASPEMQLFYDKWNLREACNFILDYNVHCNNWSQEQAMDLLVKQAFQQNTEAAEKWKRVSLSQVQLTCYFTGLTEIYELREEIKKKQGSEFNLKKFHEQFLSYGSAPVKEIRELMLK